MCIPSCKHSDFFSCKINITQKSLVELMRTTILARQHASSYFLDAMRTTEESQTIPIELSEFH